jgi:hypothetical protein
MFLRPGTHVARAAGFLPPAAAWRITRAYAKRLKGIARWAGEGSPWTDLGTAKGRAK